MYPEGLNVDAVDEELNTSFRPSPEYAELAKAAAGGSFDKGRKPEMYSTKVGTAQELEEALHLARKSVNAGSGAFIEAILH